MFVIRCVLGDVCTGFWWGDLRKKEHSEDLGIDGWIIQKFISSKWDGCMDWIDLAQNKNRRRAVVQTVTNLRVPYSTANCLNN